MTKVIVKGFLFLNTAGREPRVQHYPSTQFEGAFLKLIGPCNFAVDVLDEDTLTPVTVLADDSEFLAMRMKLQDERVGAL